jgi:hypothetical protein
VSNERLNGQVSPAQANAAGLSRQDEENLARLEQKLQLVRDRTTAVARGYSTGLFLHGSGGIGKSYTVLNELVRLQANFKLFNSRMTGRGLYNALERFPDAVHVLEDMEQIMHDRAAQGVLRSALWGQRKQGECGPMERLVTWSTYKHEHSFVFTGGIIMLSNVPLHDLPQLNAIKTRIAYMHLQASDFEIRALMRKVASRGYESEGRRLEAEACRDICEHVIQQSLDTHRTLDMRLLVNSFEDRLQWEEGDAGCHWKDLVNSRVRERPTYFQQEVMLTAQADRRRQELQIAREIVSGTEDRQERRRLWMTRTGKSEQTLYRRIAELKGEGEFSSEN